MVIYVTEILVYCYLFRSLYFLYVYIQHKWTLQLLYHFNHKLYQYSQCFALKIRFNCVPALDIVFCVPQRSNSTLALDLR